MKVTWKWIAILLVGASVSAARAQTPPSWGSLEPSKPTSATVQLGKPTVQLGKPTVGAPVAQPIPTHQPTRPTFAPTAHLSKPILLGKPTTSSPKLFPIQDGEVQPASFFERRPRRATRIGREPISEVAGVNPRVAEPSANRFAWGRSEPEVAPPPRVVPTELAPAPVAVTPPAHGFIPNVGGPDSGPILSGQPVVTGQPGASCDSCGVPAPDCECADCDYGTCCDAGPFGCGCGDVCYAPYNCFFIGVEYLMWWTSGSRLPPLVTTGSATDPIPGALGQPGTQILFGNDEVGNDIRSGARLFGGVWLTRDRTFGLDGSVFFLNEANDSFFAASPGLPVLARPFVNRTPGSARFGLEDSQLKALPNVVAGDISVDHSTNFWGYDANLRALWACGCNWSTDLILGYRGMNLEDDLRIRELIVSQTGTRGAIQITDTFSATNRFHGGQLGFLTEVNRGRWTFGFKCKVAIGNTRQRVAIAGRTNIQGTGTASDGIFNTGILATPSNSGAFSRNRFTVIPELGLDIGYHLTDHIRAFVGYDVLYWSSVVRAGEQIDRVVDTNQFAPQVAAGTRPAFSFRGTNYWAQGLRFGIEFRY